MTLSLLRLYSVVDKWMSRNISRMMQIGTNQSSGRKTVPVNQKSYMDWFGIEPRPLQWEWHCYLLWSLEQCYILMPAVDHTGVWRTDLHLGSQATIFTQLIMVGFKSVPQLQHQAIYSSLKLCGPFVLMANLNHLRWLHVNCDCHTSFIW
jgi:hypothetical protein